MKAGVRTIVIFVLAATCTPGMVAPLAGCQLQGTCDPSSHWLDGQLALTAPGNVHDPFPPGSGAVNETTWESGPIGSDSDSDAGPNADPDWINYPGQRTIFLFPNGVGTAQYTGAFPGPYTSVTAWVSPSPNANDDNWSLAPGNLAEITVHAPVTNGDTDWYVTVYNATCAPYYLRVVVTRAAPDAGANSPPDAGSDAGALPDGGTDAGAPLDGASQD